MNIKELARRAGVSSATVSRVLNNSGYVKEETRKKVLEAVEEYNYVPNSLIFQLIPVFPFVSYGMFNNTVMSL